MKIAGIQEISLIDWPGKIISILFFAGCNFRCPFCQNSDLVLENGLDYLSVEEILNFLNKYEGWLDGVELTGGEPLLQAGLEEFISKIKGKQFTVKLDTNGYLPQKLHYLIENSLIDYVAMDIKTSLNPQKYSIASGREIDIEKIKESINLIINSDIDYEFRTTFVPLLVEAEDILEIARYIKNAKRYIIQKFKPHDTLDKNYLNIGEYPQEKFEEVVKIINNEGLVKECYYR